MNNKLTWVRHSAACAAALIFGVTVSVAQPANDDCSNAIAISAGDTVTGSNVGATGSDITTCTFNDNLDVWYRLTAAQAGPHTIDTLGPVGFDTALAVFNDCNGSELACDDDGAGNLRSRVTVSLAQGETVYIRVAGYNGNSGTFTLNVRVPPPPPANDTCATAIPVAGLPFRFTQDISGAIEDVDTSCNSGAAVATVSGVWFTYTPAENQRVRLQELSAANVVMALFGGGCDSLFEIYCTDPEDVVQDLAAGQTYRILVGGQGATPLPVGSVIDFNMSVVSAATNDTCETARVVTATPYLDTVDATGAAGDVDVACNSSSNFETRHGVWYRFTPAEPGRVTLNETSVNDVILAAFTGDCTGGLTEISCSDAEPAPAIQVAAGTTYYFLVGMWSSTTVPTAPFGFSLTFVAAPGACCTASGCLIVAGSAACTSLGGTWQGSGSLCGTPQGRIDTNAAIPDYPFGGPVSPVTASVNVAETDVITDVNVFVSINHTYAGDLRVRLTGPNGVTVDLFNRAGTPTCTPGELAVGGGANDFNGDYIIDDDAATTWASALLAGPSPVPAGSYRASGCGDAPVSLNTTFGGIPMNGLWTLTVSDEDEGIVGTLVSFGMVLNGGTIQPCAGGGPGACCINASCSAVSQAECVGPGRSFSGSGTTCNAPGNGTTPCCRGDTNQDGDVALQDLFDFLSLWFAQAPGANADGLDGIGVEDLFAFLRSWFSQCN
jgi:subtilisin-like proprotein convertase family protein